MKPEVEVWLSGLTMRQRGWILLKNIWLWPFACVSVFIQAGLDTLLEAEYEERTKREEANK